MYIFAAIDLRRHFGNLNKVVQHTNNLIGTGFLKEIDISFQNNLVLLYENNCEFGIVQKNGDLITELISGYIDKVDGLKGGEWSRIQILNDGIVAASDFSGSCPLFYGVNKDVAAISNDANSLAIFLGFDEVTRESAIELVKYGHCIGRETTIKGIFRVWPEEELKIKVLLNKIEVKILYSDVLEYGANTRDSKGNLIDIAFQKLVANSKRNFNNSRTSLCQLSGGLDSRLTVAVLSRNQVSELSTFHMILTDQNESRIAKQIAETLNTRHHSVALAGATLEMAKKAWLLTSGQVGVDAAAGNLVGYKYALEHGFNQIIGGWQGDCLIGSYVPSESIFLSHRFKKLAVKNWALNRGYADDEIHSVFNGKISKKELRKSRRRLTSEINKKHFKTAAQQVSWWGMFRRQPTFSNISPARLCSDLIEKTPLLATEYIQELLNLDGSDLVNKNFYRRMIWNQFPELRHIEYANTGVVLTGDYSLDLNPPNLRRVVYTIFPVSAARQLYGKFLNIRNPVLNRNKRIDNESSHWKEILEKEIQQIQTNAMWEIKTNKSEGENSEVHYMGVFLALEWTRNYLVGFK